MSKAVTPQPERNAYMLDPAAHHRACCDWRYVTFGLRECGDLACRRCYTEAGVSILYGPPMPRFYGYEGK